MKVKVRISNIRADRVERAKRPLENIVEIELTEKSWEVALQLISFLAASCGSYDIVTWHYWGNYCIQRTLPDKKIVIQRVGCECHM